MRDGSINYGVAFILFGKFYSYEKVEFLSANRKVVSNSRCTLLHYHEGLFMIEWIALKCSMSKPLMAKYKKDWMSTAAEPTEVTAFFMSNGSVKKYMKRMSEQ